MFHGGTNFGFTSGANTNGTTADKSGYRPQLTSYDFSAPLDEAGDPTEKYHAIKQTLKNAVIQIHLKVKKKKHKNNLLSRLYIEIYDSNTIFQCIAVQLLNSYYKLNI